MSRSEKKYQELKSYYQEQASIKEKELHMDLLAVRHEYVPHHLKQKFLTGLGIFGTVYLAEKLIFGKRLPRILRFTTSIAATVATPRVYRFLENKLLGIGELSPVELEMLEDQPVSQNSTTDTDPLVRDPEVPMSFPEKPFETQTPPPASPSSTQTNHLDADADRGDASQPKPKDV